MHSGHLYKQVAKATGRVISAESALGDTRIQGAGERRMGGVMEERGGGLGGIGAMMNATWLRYGGGKGVGRGRGDSPIQHFVTSTQHLYATVPRGAASTADQQPALPGYVVLYLS